MKLSKTGLLAVLAGLGLASVGGVAIAKKAKANSYSSDDVETDYVTTEEDVEEAIDVDYIEE